MARTTTREKINLKDEDIRALWAQVQSTEELSHKWNCSPQTTRKILKSAGVDFSAIKVPRKKRNKGEFAQWLREHPSQELPPSFKEIAKISGCSLGSIRLYFYREQDKAYQRWKLYLPKFIKSFKFTGKAEGRSYQDLVSSSFTVDRYTFGCQLKLTFKDETVLLLRIPYTYLDKENT